MSPWLLICLLSCIHIRSASFCGMPCVVTDLVCFDFEFYLLHSVLDWIWDMLGGCCVAVLEIHKKQMVDGQMS